MDALSVGLRAQDYHESLRNVGAFAPKDVHFKQTLLIGKAASLAMHLRGLLYVNDFKLLEYAAASLGIGSLELPAVLRQLEEVDFVTVVRGSDKETIKRVEIKVPEFRSGYQELGQRWLELRPSEIEHAGVEALNTLYKGPVRESDLRAQISLDSSAFAAMTDVMQAGQLWASQPIDGRSVVFTPLAVDGNPTAYLQWAYRFPKEVATVINLLKAGQGLPLNSPEITSNPAIVDAIATGVVLPVQVSGATGAQRFVFAPRGGLQEAQRAILDKARALVACVRYGQNFAAGRPIFSPKAILQRLKDYKRFSRGHPDLISQYGLLVEKLIGHPVDEGHGRWNFEIDDTDENMAALQIAIEMLEHGDSPSANVDLEAQKALLSPASYLSPPSVRPRLVADASISTETRTSIIKEMAKLARGMKA